MVEANVLYRAGRLDEAATGFRAVLKLEPRSHGALNNLGAILQQSSPPRLQEALLVYTAAMALPNSVADPALLNSYGTLLCNFEERYSEARESFKRALSVDPNFKAAKQGLRWVEAQLN
jgi:Tfp pilus assembly protein PilF